MPHRTVLAIRHVQFEDLGVFAGVLDAHGFAVQYCDAGVDDLQAVAPLAPDLLVVLGGPIGAYEDRLYPFLKDELSLLERRLKANRPTLGICLGSQLIARALGARVYPGPTKEIGWAPLILTDAGHTSPLTHLGPDHTPVLHWHGDTFDLPSGATLLASTPQIRNQAVAYGPNIVGLQFHGEVEAEKIERWLVGHACEIAATSAVSVEALRADSTRFGKILARQGRLFMREWLKGLQEEEGGSACVRNFL